jgi:hypothetical protein
MTSIIYKLLSLLIPPTLPTSSLTLEMRMRTMISMKMMRLRSNKLLTKAKRLRLLLRPMPPHSRFSRID